MGVYDDLGVRTVINASGTLTRLGGSRMAPEVAGGDGRRRRLVRPHRRAAGAGRRGHRRDHRRRGRLRRRPAPPPASRSASPPASPGWTSAKMDRLPDTDRHEERGRRPARTPQRLRPRHPRRRRPLRRGRLSRLPRRRRHLRLADRRGDHRADGGGRLPDPRHARHAAAAGGLPRSPTRKGVPVIVDAAAELPPRANLRRFIAEGADLVVFSGGKAIGGPQASGILAGRADLIASVAFQHQDMDVRAETWSKRPLLDRRSPRRRAAPGVRPLDEGRPRGDRRAHRRPCAATPPAPTRRTRRAGRRCSTAFMSRLGESAHARVHRRFDPAKPRARLGDRPRRNRARLLRLRRGQSPPLRRTGDRGRRIARRVRHARRQPPGSDGAGGGRGRTPVAGGVERGIADIRCRGGPACPPSSPSRRLGQGGPMCPSRRRSDKHPESGSSAGPTC